MSEIPEHEMDEAEFARSHLRLVNQKLIDKIAELEEAGRQRAKLLVDIVNAQERERALIAADIHDDSIQIMSALALRLELLADDLSDEAQRAALDDAAERVREGVKRLRRLIFDLSPRAVQTGGLGSAIEVYLREVAAEAGFDWAVDHTAAAELPPEVETILYRIAQEAIRNAQKHAHAHNVRVTLRRERNGTTLRVADDGIGLSRDTAFDQRPGHIGLVSMRERAVMAGGRLELDSAPGAGCVVEVHVPHGAAARNGLGGAPPA